MASCPEGRVRPFGMRLIRNTLLLVALCAAVVSSWAVLPLIGATTVLAPAMRLMLARATEAAVSAVGTTSVRAAIPQIAPIAGMAVGVTVSRLASAANVIGAALGVGAIGSSLAILMDRAGCELGLSGFKCDPGVAPTVSTVPCLKADQGPGVWGGQPCHTSISAAADGYAAFLGTTSTAGGCSSYTKSYSVTTYPGAVGQYGTMSRTEVYPNCPQYNYTYTGISYRVFQSGTQQQTTCPGGLPFAEWDPTKCTTDPAGWPASTLAQVKDRVVALVNAQELVDLAKDAGDAGVEIPEAQAPVTVEGPATVALPSTTTTTTAPDGTVTEKVVQPVAHVTYEGAKITYNITTTTTTTVTAPGQPPVVTVTVDGTAPSPDAAPAEDPVTCGLPGTPPCKIDETGTPTDTWVSPASPGLTDLGGGILGTINAPGPTVLPWSIAGALSIPVGSCSPLVMGSSMGEFSIDVCGSPIAAIWRQMLAWFLSMGALWYLWQTANRGMAGSSLKG